MTTPELFPLHRSAYYDPPLSGLLLFPLFSETWRLFLTPFQSSSDPFSILLLLPFSFIFPNLAPNFSLPHPQPVRAIV